MAYVNVIRNQHKKDSEDELVRNAEKKKKKVITLRGSSVTRPRSGGSRSNRRIAPKGAISSRHKSP